MTAFSLRLHRLFRASATLAVRVFGLFVLCSAAVFAAAQNVTFNGDLTPPSSSVSGPQVTFGTTVSAVNLGSVIVCPLATPGPTCTETQVLSYGIHFTGTLGPTKVVTEGVSDLDFRLSYSSCTGAQEPGATCLVGLTFNPLAPGLRRGAVQITDSNGFPILTTLLYGIGDAPQVGFSPAAENNITTGPNQPSGVAVNAQGDVFYTDSAAGTLLKVPANARLSQTVLDSGFSHPSGVALDGAGNIYVADTGHNIVLKVPPGGGPGVPVGQALSSPTGVAVDGLGNVFISNPPINYVVEVPITGAPETTVGGGYLNPNGIAVDFAGNLYVADTGNGRLVKVPPGQQQVTVHSGFQAPLSVAVDAAGNIFVGDTNSDSIVELPADGRLTPGIGSGFIRPTGLALDPSGNLYVTDLSRAEVVELIRSGPPNLTFADTPVNSISSDSPKFVTAENTGNNPLFIQQSPTTVDPAFVIVHGPTSLPYCTAGVTVAPGTACTLPFSFQPTTIGTITSAYVLASNNLNTNYNQSIGLSGTATGIVPNLLPGLPPSAYYGASFNAQAISNSPGAITCSLVSGPAIVTPSCNITIAGEGLITVLVSQAASPPYLATSVQAVITGSRAGTFSTMTAVPVASGFGTAAQIVVTVHPDTSGTPTGFVNFYIDNVLTTKLPLVAGVATYTTTQLSPGTHAFTAVYLGDSNFDVSLASVNAFNVPGSTVKLSVLDSSVRFPLPAVLLVQVVKSSKANPNGRVMILDGSTQVASFSLLPVLEGYSLPVLLELARGTHTLTAVYAGDKNYQPGISPPVTVTVK